MFRIHLRKKLIFNTLIVIIFLLNVGMEANNGNASTNSNLTIEPMADTYVDSIQPNVNFGTVTTLDVQYYSNGLGSVSQAQAYFLFDLNSFSCSGQMQFNIFTLSSASLVLAVYEVNDTTWSENNMTWNNRPAYSNDSLLSTTSLLDQKYTSFNISNSNLNESKLSFVVVSQTNSFYTALIYSRENFNDHPYLSCVSVITANTNIITNNNSDAGLLLIIFLVIMLVIIGFIYNSKKSSRRNYYQNMSPQQNTQINQSNFLKSLWYCPFDRNPLQMLVNPVAQTQYFTINRGNVQQGIQNAISIRKIPHEAYIQTEQLVMYVFSNTTKNEITLVSVRCPVCGKLLSAPKVD